MKSLIFLTLFITQFLQATCLESKKILFFANGMFNERIDAQSSLLALKEQIEQKQKELSFVDYKVAYNTNEAALLQMLEVFLQKRNETKLNFWKWIGHSFAIENKDSFKLIIENYYKEEKFKDVDLRIQVKNYKDEGNITVKLIEPNQLECKSDKSQRTVSIVP